MRGAQPSDEPVSQEHPTGSHPGNYTSVVDNYTHSTKISNDTVHVLLLYINNRQIPPQHSAQSWAVTVHIK